STEVRPTTGQLREALFNICQLYVEGARFLDLFAGSGAMGLEALSRGAAHATFVDNHRPALQAIRHNIASLKVEKETTVLTIDVFKALKLLAEQEATFEIIYADPPYGKTLSAPVLEFIDKSSLLTQGGLLFIEDSSLNPPPLEHLHLKNERRAGRAILSCFQ
ncbi:MAG: 16S rRNA (guanine(966)-N(2))-methyltransferase RsmD, partial [Chlamydiia bacterium]|nr:16S rRNA (guanine(966)-N(2))-methyltransferase RsmD [Chlamydiia bacterium]